MKQQGKAAGARFNPLDQDLFLDLVNRTDAEQVAAEGQTTQPSPAPLTVSDGLKCFVEDWLGGLTRQHRRDLGEVGLVWVGEGHG